jgi:hypothetical protein
MPPVFTVASRVEQNLLTVDTTFLTNVLIKFSNWFAFHFDGSEIRFVGVSRVKWLKCFLFVFLEVLVGFMVQWHFIQISICQCNKCNENFFTLLFITYDIIAFKLRCLHCHPYIVTLCFERLRFIKLQWVYGGNFCKRYLSTAMDLSYVPKSVSVRKSEVRWETTYTELLLMNVQFGNFRTWKD